MGIFSSKREVTVQSTSIRLVEDNPTLIKNSVVASVFEKTNMTNDILKNQLNSLTLKTHQAIKYAELHYSYGLPSGSMELGVGDDSLVQPVVVSEVGQNVQLVSNVLDIGNTESLAHPFLQENRGWDNVSDVVTNPPFIPPQTASAVTFIQAAITATDTVTITYEYTDNGLAVEVTEDINVPGASGKDRYYHVSYYPLDYAGSVSGPLKYWNYKESTNVYPQLTLGGDVGLESPFYPIIPIRVNNVDRTAVEFREDTEFKTSSILMNKLGMDFVTIGDSVNTNPDIELIDHAYVHFGVDLQGDTSAELEYNYEFFAYLSAISDHDKSDYDSWEAGGKTTPPPTNHLRMSDELFDIKLSYNYSEIELNTGSIGPIGTITRTNNIESKGNILLTKYLYEKSSIVFSKQITATEYLSVTVKGLVHSNYIYENNAIVTNIYKSTLSNNDGFIIPLNRFIVSKLPLQKETELMYTTFRITFNSYDIVSTSFFESDAFRVILLIVVIIVSILYPPSAGVNFAAWAGLQGAVAALVALLVNVAISFALSKVFAILVEAVGIENSFIVAMLTLVAALYMGQGDISFGDLITSENLLMVVNGIVQGININVQKDMEDLMSDSEKFWEQAEKKDDELEVAQELLESIDDLDPFTFIKPNMYFNPDESSEEFYNRTIHSGNVGVLAYAAVSNYVDTKLTLPETRTTVGSNPLGDLS